MLTIDTLDDILKQWNGTQNRCFGWVSNPGTLSKKGQDGKNNQGRPGHPGRNQKRPTQTGGPCSGMAQVVERSPGLSRLWETFQGIPIWK